MALIDNKYPVLVAMPPDGQCPFVWFKEYRCVRKFPHNGACLIEKDGQELTITPESSRQFLFYNNGSWACPQDAVPSLWRALKMRVDPSVG